MINTNIPSEILDVANSAALFDKVELVTKPFELHINQVGELDSIVRQALKGEIPREEILKYIVENLEVDDVTGSKILKTINLEIFQKLRELILETHNEKEGGNAEETLAQIENTVTEPLATKLPINVLEKNTPHDLAKIPGQTAHNVPHVEQTPPTPPIVEKPRNPLQGLTAPVHNPMESEVLQPKKSPNTRGYDTVDPYREPIN
ncbi:MAG: hypothetical protein HZA80_00750 [Candidatus Taylorbacteria bacterium]|nr:hypothetical protein [Candidatus Taylorbacteria bacterium]